MKGRDPTEGGGGWSVGECGGAEDDGPDGEAPPQGGAPKGELETESSGIIGGRGSLEDHGGSSFELSEPLILGVRNAMCAW